MKMKKYMKRFFVLMFFVLFACVLTGCNSDVENGDSCYVRFTEAGESASRGLVTDEEDAASFDNLVWAYIAVKKDGMHTLGASEEVTSHTDGVTEKDSAGRIYTLRPVRKDYSKGLGMENGPFSYGEWEFRLYGYKSYDGSKFNDLVYTGVTVPSLTVINPLSATEISSGVTSVSVPFTITDKRTDNKGKLVLGNIYFSVPDGLTLPNGSTLKITVKQGSAFTATATNTLTAEAHTGDRIGPLSFSAASAEWAEGTYTLTVDATVTPSGGSAENITGSSFAYPLVISRGVTSTVSGDISDLKTTTDTVYNADYKMPLCKIGTTYYYDLQSAVAACTSGGVIELVRNVDNAGTVTFTGNKDINIRLGGFSISNFKYEKADGSGNLDILPDNGATDYIRFASSGCSVRNVYADATSKTLWLNTINGVCECYAPNYDVWHSGSIGTLNLYYSKSNRTSNLGYHLLCDVMSKVALKAESGKLATAKFLDMGVVDIMELDLGDPAQSAVSLRGVTGTSIRNMSAIRNSFDTLNGKSIASALVKVGFYYNKCSKILYGIEGTIMDISGIVLDGKTITSWYTDLSLSRVISSSTLYQVGGDSSLYAMSDIKNIGGKVYYVDTTVTDCAYFFYDNNNNIVNITPGTTGEVSSSATKYSYVSKDTKDRYYVWNKNLQTTSRLTIMKKSAMSGGQTLSTSYENGGVTYSVKFTDSPPSTPSASTQWFEDNSSLGYGKGNTDYFMNMRSDASAAQMNSANYVGSTDTVWNYLKNKINNVGSTQNTTGCYDWYVPSGTEARYLYAYDSTSEKANGAYRFMSSSPVRWIGHDTDYGMYTYVLWGSSVNKWGLVTKTYGDSSTLDDAGNKNFPGGYWNFIRSF